MYITIRYQIKYHNVIQFGDHNYEKNSVFSGNCSPFFSLAACGSSGDSADGSSQEAESSSAAALSLGETASTDIVDVTLTECNLAIFASAVSDASFLRPAEESSIYGASVGHSLVIPTFTLTNKDRSGSISVADSFDWPLAWSVSYDGNEYPIMSFDLNSNDGGTRGIRLSPAAIINSETGDMIEKNDSSNYLLSAGETVSFRTIGILNMEPASWDDGFDLIIDIPNSSGEYESFTYSIPEES